MKNLWPVLFLAFALLALVSCRCSEYLDELRDTPSGLGPCPCSVTQARSDEEFEESDPNVSNMAKYHPGADACFRSVSATSSGSGQQCCYDASGDLITTPPGGGTPDRYSPHYGLFGWYKHLRYDVWPWDHCCDGKLDSANCTVYYRYRPVYGCSGYVG